MGRQDCPEWRRLRKLNIAKGIELDGRSREISRTINEPLRTAAEPPAAVAVAAAGAGLRWATEGRSALHPGPSLFRSSPWLAAGMGIGSVTTGRKGPYCQDWQMLTTAVGHRRLECAREKRRAGRLSIAPCSPLLSQRLSALVDLGTRL